MDLRTIPQRRTLSEKKLQVVLDKAAATLERSRHFRNGSKPYQTYLARAAAQKALREQLLEDQRKADIADAVNRVRVRTNLARRAYRLHPMQEVLLKNGQISQSPSVEASPSVSHSLIPLRKVRTLTNMQLHTMDTANENAHNFTIANLRSLLEKPPINYVKGFVRPSPPPSSEAIQESSKDVVKKPSKVVQEPTKIVQKPSKVIQERSNAIIQARPKGVQKPSNVVQGRPKVSVMERFYMIQEQLKVIHKRSKVVKDVNIRTEPRPLLTNPMLHRNKNLHLGPAKVPTPRVVLEKKKVKAIEKVKEKVTGTAKDEENAKANDKNKNKEKGKDRENVKAKNEEEVKDEDKIKGKGKDKVKAKEEEKVKVKNIAKDEEKVKDEENVKDKKKVKDEGKVKDKKKAKDEGKVKAKENVNDKSKVKAKPIYEGPPVPIWVSDWQPPRSARAAVEEYVDVDVGGPENQWEQMSSSSVYTGLLSSRTSSTMTMRTSSIKPTPRSSGTMRTPRPESESKETPLGSATRSESEPVVIRRRQLKMTLENPEFVSAMEAIVENLKEVVTEDAAAKGARANNVELQLVDDESDYEHLSNMKVKEDVIKKTSVGEFPPGIEGKTVSTTLSHFGQPFYTKEGYVVVDVDNCAAEPIYPPPGPGFHNEPNLIRIPHEAVEKARKKNRRDERKKVLEARWVETSNASDEFDGYF